MTYTHTFIPPKIVLRNAKENISTTAFVAVLFNNPVPIDWLIDSIGMNYTPAQPSIEPASMIATLQNSKNLCQIPFACQTNLHLSAIVSILAPGFAISHLSLSSSLALAVARAVVVLRRANPFATYYLPFPFFFLYRCPFRWAPNNTANELETGTPALFKF